jgi:hypothetical protein
MRLSAMGLFLVVACGGTAAVAPPVAASLPAELETVYENGADFVDDPEILQGRWRDDWSQELDSRVRTADIIAIVNVPTLRTDIDPEGRMTFRLNSVVDTSILGDASGEIPLESHQGELGFTGVRSNERRIQSQPMVLFLIWAADEDGSTIARWHLSPGTEQVISRVRYLAERRRGVEREGQPGRVIVHQN